MTGVAYCPSSLECRCPARVFGWEALEEEGVLLGQERVRYEAEALAEQARHCPEHVPELYHFDPQVLSPSPVYLPAMLKPCMQAGATLAGMMPGRCSRVMSSCGVEAVPGQALYGTELG